MATATTNLLNTPLPDPRVERVRRTALAAYVDGKISFAQANSRVRKAIDRFTPTVGAHQGTTALGSEALGL
ncbi:hypothetical protein Ga0074812_12431 [Parafrankia irregularis]|uniref:Uncharacterized protein n=1 Tax=Parafrankia irregularis TaxID=795642 RepID=A0A0S4QV96_9ACTN|nr:MULTISPECIES: hypothetical protein [Parafrankia]MBE3203751.1 hypothetical protein [Parafrankia sp. CH37]CUU59006.1 hypothetical protein Ga0074812_12431 [Parafrankia irregularis]